MNWLQLALISALFLGLYDVAKKTSLKGESAFLVLLTSSYFASFLALAVLFLNFIAPSSARSLNLSCPPLAPRAIALVFFKSALVSASWLCNFHAQKQLPLSIAAPLRATAPIVTLFLAVAFLGESPSKGEWLGIALILVSYLSLSTVTKLEGIQLTRNRAVAWLALGTFLGALSGLYDKRLLGPEKLPPLSLQLAFTFGNSLLLSFIFLFLSARGKIERPGKLPWKRGVFLIAVCLLLADFAYFRALSEPDTLISLVSATRRSSVVVSFLLSGLILKENNLQKKFVSVALALLGVIVLSVV